MAVAVMNAQPVRPLPQQPTEDPFDKIAKAVNIASTVYGMYDRYSDNAINKLKAENAAKKLAQDDIEKAKQIADKKTMDNSEILARGQKLENGKVVEDTESSFYKNRQSVMEKATEDIQLRKDSLALQKKQLELTRSQDGFKQLPQDQKILVEKFAGTKAQLTPIVDQFDQTLAQLNDPTIPENQKLQVARQAMKIMNSPLNPDAVGAEEVKRLGSFLTPGPDPMGPKGMKFGVDIDGFTQAVQNSRDRLYNTKESVSNQIDQLMKRSLPEVANQQAQTHSQRLQRPTLLQNKVNAGDIKPPVMQNGIQYNWNAKTGRYE